MSRRGPTDGFSLIESLVALVILSVSATSLLTYTQNHVRQLDGIVERTAARWVGEHALMMFELGLEPLPTAPQMLGRQFVVTADTNPTTDPFLSRIDIRVLANSKVSADSPSLFSISGYVTTQEENE